MKYLFLVLSLILVNVGKTEASITRNNDSNLVITDLLDSAEAYAKKDVLLAKSLAVKAAGYAENLGLDYQYARAVFIQGYINQVNKEMDTAIVSYLKASALMFNMRDEQSKRLNAICSRNIGLIFSNYSQLAKAREYFGKSIDISNEIGDHNLERLVLYDRARVLRKQDDFVAAIDDLFRATEIAMEDDQFEFLVRANNQLGLLFKDVGDYEKAMTHYAEVFRYRNHNIRSFANHAGRAYHNMANIYLYQGDSAKAEAYFLKAIDERVDNNFKSKAFYSFMDLAELYQQQGKWTLAEKYYTEAVNSGFSLKGKQERFKVYKQIADLAILQNNVGKFVEYNAQYTAMLEEVVSRNVEIQQLDQQHNIELVTERYFELVAAKQREEDLRQWATWAIILILLSVATIATILKVRALRNKRLMEKELQEVLVDLNLNDL